MSIRILILKKAENESCPHHLGKSGGQSVKEAEEMQPW